MQEFVIHVNSFKPDKLLSKEDFNNIFYTSENNGVLPESSALQEVYHRIELNYLRSDF